MYKDLYPQDANNLESVLQGLDAGSISRDLAITAIAQASGVSWETAAGRYDTAMQAQALTVALAGSAGLKGVTEKTAGPATTKQSQAETKPSSGAENSALYPKLKDELMQQNMKNIAKQDPRLAEAVKGSGTTNPNFSVGIGTAAEAENLGKIWVGDGGKLVDNQMKCPGCWISADGTRLYRPPTNKKSQFATTGIQANFQQFDKSGAMISNGHLNVSK